MITLLWTKGPAHKWFPMFVQVTRCFARRPAHLEHTFGNHILLRRRPIVWKFEKLLDGVDVCPLRY